MTASSVLSKQEKEKTISSKSLPIYQETTASKYKTERFHLISPYESGPNQTFSDADVLIIKRTAC